MIIKRKVILIIILIFIGFLYLVRLSHNITYSDNYLKIYEKELKQLYDNYKVQEKTIKWHDQDDGRNSIMTYQTYDITYLNGKDSYNNKDDFLNQVKENLYQHVQDLVGEHIDFDIIVPNDSSEKITLYQKFGHIQFHHPKYMFTKATCYVYISDFDNKELFLQNFQDINMVIYKDHQSILYIVDGKTCHFRSIDDYENYISHINN